MFPSNEELATLRVFPGIESRTLEFKQTTDVPFTKILPTVCAFLNVGGGSIVFGVKDNQEIVGIKTNDKRFDIFLLLVDNILHTNLIVTTAGEPIHPDSILTRCVPCWNGNSLLILDIRGEKGKQYQLKEGSRYHRLNASNMRVSGSNMYNESDVLLRIENTKQYIHEQYQAILQKVERQMMVTQKRMEEVQKEQEETIALLHTKILEEKDQVMMEQPRFFHYLLCGLV
jgi:predicted HTH transcriptional regulator